MRTQITGIDVLIGGRHRLAAVLREVKPEAAILAMTGGETTPTTEVAHKLRAHTTTVSIAIQVERALRETIAKTSFRNSGLHRQLDPRLSTAKAIMYLPKRQRAFVVKEIAKRKAKKTARPRRAKIDQRFETLVKNLRANGQG